MNRIRYKIFPSSPTAIEFMTQKEILSIGKFIRCTLAKNKKWRDFIVQLCDVDDLIQEAVIALLRCEARGYKLNAGFTKCVAKNTIINYINRKCRWFTKVPRDNKNQYKVIIPTKVGYLRCLLTKYDSLFCPKDMAKETELYLERLAFIGKYKTKKMTRKHMREMFWAVQGSLV